MAGIGNISVLELPKCLIRKLDAGLFEGRNVIGPDGLLVYS